MLKRGPTALFSFVAKGPFPWQIKCAYQSVAFSVLLFESASTSCENQLYMYCRPFVRLLFIRKEEYTTGRIIEHDGT